MFSTLELNSFCQPNFLSCFLSKYVFQGVFFVCVLRSWMCYYVCISDVIWCISCNSLEPFKGCLNIYCRLMDARLIHWLRFLRENRHGGISQRRWTWGKITFSEIFQFETLGRGSGLWELRIPPRKHKICKIFKVSQTQTSFHQLKK